jgi:phospholipid transport system transporter-binding protein
MLVLPAELTQRETTACLRMLSQGLRTQSGSAVVADASALTKFDSSALALLLECRRESLAMGKSFSVHGLPAGLRKLAVLYGVAPLLPAASAGGAGAAE